MIQPRFSLRFVFAIALVIGLGSASPVRADVRLPGLFSDNMVLQQGVKVEIWGWAEDGEKITVSFRGQKATTTAAGGKWSVSLSKLTPGGPDSLTVTGRNSIELKNVLVGDVWVCGGQSNMEFRLQDSFESEADIQAATNRRIRLFLVPRLRCDEPTNNIPSAWKVATPTNAANFSAVAWYFARDLQPARGVPIGLIESCWGGTPAESWTRRAILEAKPRYQREIFGPLPEAERKYQVALAAFELKRDEAKKNGVPFTNRPPAMPWKPSELYNGMIAPLVHYAIKGAIWYQGEANANRAAQYRELFPDMISNWRADWREPKFPFLVVQLAPYRTIKDHPAESDWAELREAQLNTAKILPKVGLAVITDIGDPANIHPTKKQPVGARLALAARGIAYGEPIVYSGPIYRSMKIESHAVVLAFDHVGGGLEARDGALKGFAICGADKKFVWADAKIEEQHVIVSSPQVANPVAVRYGWADCPVVNLWNKDGLPASPFRTDDFPMITAGK